MFIEPAAKYSSSPQRSETDLSTIRGNIALRGSAGRAYNCFYKHLAPLEPKHYLVAVLAAA
jgi:hypothetical protein